MAAGDLYELVLEMKFLSQTCLNVFHYVQEATIVPITGSVEDVLAANWRDQKLPKFKAMHSTDVTYTAIRVRNLFDYSKSATLLLSEAGQLSSAIDQVLPAFNAIAFTLNPSEPVTRKGSKRVPGVLESVQVDGIITDATYLPVLAEVAQAMQSPVTGGLIIQDPVWFPVLIKRVKTGQAGSEKYRLPKNTNEAVFTRVKEAVLQVLITSQNSRKIGKGM